MARPNKNNADYFSHDNDMRNDDKIKALRKNFWHIWFSIWNMFLEKLCDADNFKLEINELNLELWGWDFDIWSLNLSEIIDYLLKLSLLKQDWNIIYSQKLIDRFEGLIAKRNRDKERLSQRKQEIKKIIVNDNTQSKVKKSKVKKSKVNISKDIIKKDIEKDFDNFEINENDSIETKLMKTLWKFIQFRKIDLKKPIKEWSKQAFIKNLEKISWNNKEIAVEILNNSIANGWQGIFPLKNIQNIQKPKQNTWYVIVWNDF